jgi:hypothetical protein
MDNDIHLPKAFRLPFIAMFLSLTLANCAETTRNIPVAVETPDPSHAGPAEPSIKTTRHVFRELHRIRQPRKPHKLRKRWLSLTIRTAQLIYMRNPPPFSRSFETKIKTVYGMLDTTSKLLRTASRLQVYEEFHRLNNLDIFAITLERPINQPSDPDTLPGVEK